MKDELKKYKSTDYYLWFQTNGVNFLFTELCGKYYCLLDGVVTSKDDLYLQYLHNDKLLRAKESYTLYYKDVATVQESCNRFNTAGLELRVFKENILNKDTITLEDFDRMVVLSAITLEEYAKFDHIYTDYLFKDTRENIKQLITLVMEKKNSLREVINEIFFNEDSCLNILIQKISQQSSILEAELFYSTVENTRNLLSGKDFIKTLTKNNDYVLIRENNQYTYFFGDEATAFIDSFEVKKDLSKETTLKGTSVSKKGIYKGKVKKLFVDYTSLKDSITAFNNIESGIILVTDSTVPEMLPVMSKSLAIITDMGGMLSHAAITSRELGIPCIIGTKDGTRILKDGDIIEVDANNGIVRIIKK